MLWKIALWAVVAVAVVFAVQILLREGPPPSLVAPPRMELPALDDVAERAPPEPVEPAVPELREEGAAVDDARPASQPTLRSNP